VLSAIVPFEEGLSEEALELRVTLEAEHHLSTSLDAVALDFERLGPRSDGRDDVLLVACRKEVVAEQRALAEAAGLEAAVVDVEGYALWRALGAARAQRAREERVTALFLLGAGALQLFVYRGARLLYARSDAVGYGEEVMLSEAALAAYLEVAPAQVERALTSLYGAHPTLVLEDVAVAGAGAALPGLMPALEGRLGRPCWITDPFLRMVLGPCADASLLAAQAPALMVACGLALRGCAA
jgi:type IV pilus assembly protein PilM